MSEHVLSFTGLETQPRQTAATAARGPALAAAQKNKRGKSLEYRALFVATFAVFLVAAIVEALIPKGIKANRVQSKETVWRRASFGAQTCVAYAFMG